MSYKSLLFCADENTARLVTQVLSELDFTAELAVETYATAKRLADEHFDALVVDCQNEQDASVLFKAARNSAENHSSLSVAVVEGQAGVAKAFRIGANLVLTKPINVEQSKSTLRVARGLLKKNQAKSATSGKPETAQPASTFVPPALKATPAASAFSAAASSSSSAFAPVPQAATQASANVPFASLEIEKEPTPTAEAADLAVLESLPKLPKAKSSDPSTAAFKADKPFVVGSSAAAAAPAVEKKPPELSPAGSSPLVTNEPIVRAADAPTPFEMHAPVPTFSTLDSHAKEGGGVKNFLKSVLAFALLGVAFYLGWQKLPGLLHRNPPAPKVGSAQPPQTEPPVVQPNATPQPAVAATQQAVSSTTPPADETIPPSGPEQIAVAGGSSTQTAPTAENIEVQEMPFSRDPKVTVTPKAQPLVVKSDAARRSTHQTVTPAAPSLDVASTGSNSPIADLVTSDAPLPNPAPGTIRISQGVSQGLLMKKVAPIYPAMALQLHKQGTVDLLATIGRDGRIGNVKVLSGDQMLAGAARDAVRQWRYRPYLLDGQPVEIETQVSISFKLPK